MIRLLRFIIKKIYLKYKFGIKLDLTTNIRSDIFIEEKVQINRYCNINCKKIGRYTFIGNGTNIDSSTYSIGRFCSIAKDVKIGVGPHPDFCISTHPFCYDSSYGFIKEKKFDKIEFKGYTNIGNDVLISSNAVILAGVNIGDGAIIGAGAIVTKDVPPYAIVVGVPAKVIRYRFSSSEIECLLKKQWWNKNIADLKRNIDLFCSIENINKL